ncbi:HlyD family secretion protein [Nguyenibacter vanlangensis]|uniref:HlyD family secretion protein n=1 Tax=Nguyenibacter vanlangensis TaxID=1216886 RepID=A0ABZ3D0B7_9PROT
MTQQDGSASGSQDMGNPPSPTVEWHPPRRNAIVITITLMLAAIAVACTLSAFELPPFGFDGVRTDDAYVQGHVTVVAPQVPGYIRQVLVDDYAHVRKGQVLVQIDESSYDARVAQAQADVASREATLANNRQNQASARAGLEQRDAALQTALAHLAQSSADHHRQELLVADQTVSRRDYDAGLATLRSDEAAVRQARADLRAAETAVTAANVEEQVLRAIVRQAKAALNSALIDLDRTHIRAESDGVIGRTGGTHVGAYVGAGTALFSLVPDERWVIADYKEAQTSRMRVGQHATFTVDALAGEQFSGHITRVAPATGSEFALVKPDNATGNFVKVPQRIGIYIAIDPGQKLAERLAPGMSVEVFVATPSDTTAHIPDTWADGTRP